MTATVELPLYKKQRIQSLAWEGLSCREIAAIVGCAPSTAAVHAQGLLRPANEGGRPPVPDSDQTWMIELRKAGKSTKEIAKLTGFTVRTVRRYVYGR